MREFADVASFAAHLLTINVAIEKSTNRGLEKAAKLIENDAKRQIGHYQDAVGPFQDWAELADSTKADRVRQGYTENDPGLRSGDMQANISHEVAEQEAVVGSPDDKMYWFEFGSEKQPPRPVIGPAAFKNKEAIQKILGEAMVEGLIGGEAIHQSLGYDFET